MVPDAGFLGEWERSLGLLVSCSYYPPTVVLAVLVQDSCHGVHTEPQRFYTTSHDAMGSKGTLLTPAMFSGAQVAQKICREKGAFR